MDSGAGKRVSVKANHVRCLICDACRATELDRSFFRFPSHPDVRRKWVEFCVLAGVMNENDIITTGIYLCGHHFSVHDLGPKRNRLTKYAVPKILKLKPAVIKNKTENVMNKNVIIKTEDILEPENVESVKTEPPIDNEQCRLCLESVNPLYSLQSVITFDDGSILDVYQAYQKVTRETDEQMQNKKYPSNLCMTCLKLLDGANNFYEQYQKSLVLVEEILDRWSQQPASHIPEQETIRICKKKVKNSQERKVQSNQDVQLHKCPVCPKFFSALDLKKHCWEHDAFKSYMRAAPKFKRKVKFFAQPRSIVPIFKVGNPSFNCSFCTEQLDIKSYFKHIAGHEKTKNFKCKKCSRTFLEEQHLRHHLHKAQAPYQCPESGCGKYFFRKINFDCHMMRHKNPDDIRFRCSMCSKVFDKRQYLERHLLYHKRSMSYKEYCQQNGRYVECKACRQKFLTSDQLEKHDCGYSRTTCSKKNNMEFRRHPCYKKRQLRKKKLRQKVPVLCYVCGRRVYHIKRHMLRHVRVKKKDQKKPKEKGLPIMCSHCGKFFRYMSKLSRHVQSVHTDIQMNYCQYCSKGFKSVNRLKAHERIHLTVRLVCELCGKEFTAVGLTRHKKSVHADLLAILNEANIENEMEM